MKILVTGSNGQLGSEIKILSSTYPKLEFTFADLPELDISNQELLSTFVKENQIQAIINCAAYTAVDRAEEDAESAFLVNAEAVSNLAVVAEECHLKLIHISTDYVFDGTNYIPYCEKQNVMPIGVYGRTKREGELRLEESKLNGIVIRTSWLYSSFGNNFVKTMLRLGQEREDLGVIFDQVGTPTYARDLAVACLEIISKTDRLDAYGKIYHFSNEGVASWYDFAKSIMELGHVNCRVFPIETKDYPTLAQRPHYSVLNKTKIKRDFRLEIPYWRDSLAECIHVLQKCK